jgi:hypothetical protein
MSSSWGNYGMRDTSEEPAKSLNNSSSYGYRGIFQDAWYDNYEVISNVNDGMNAILGGLEMGEEGSTDTIVPMPSRKCARDLPRDM